MSNETTYNMKDKLGPVGEGLKATLPLGGTIECFFCEDGSLYYILQQGTEVKYLRVTPGAVEVMLVMAEHLKQNREKQL